MSEHIPVKTRGSFKEEEETGSSAPELSHEQKDPVEGFSPKLTQKHKQRNGEKTKTAAEHILNISR